MTDDSVNTDDEALPKLRPKTKAFIDLLDKDPKLTATKAYLATHETTNVDSARASASETLARPNVIIYRAKHVALAKQTVVAVMNNASKRANKPVYQRLALDASNSILDRQLGKATTRVESTNTNLNLSVKANMKLSEDFTAFLKAKTTIDTSSSEN